MRQPHLATARQANLMARLQEAQSPPATTCATNPPYWSRDRGALTGEVTTVRQAGEEVWYRARVLEVIILLVDWEPLPRERDKRTLTEQTCALLACQNDATLTALAEQLRLLGETLPRSRSGCKVRPALSELQALVKAAAQSSEELERELAAVFRMNMAPQEECEMTPHRLKLLPWLKRTGRV